MRMRTLWVVAAGWAWLPRRCCILTDAVAVVNGSAITKGLPPENKDNSQYDTGSKDTGSLTKC
jgi:hypothetical protein